MAKLTRKWIELDWAQTNLVLRAEDIPFSVDQSIKDAIDENNGKVAVTGGDPGFIEEVLQAGDNVSLDVNGNALVVSSDDRASQQETFEITSTNLTNGYITTSYDIYDETMVSVYVVGGTTQRAGSDYYVDGNNIIWTGHELENFIELNDIIKVSYTRQLNTPGAMTNYRKIKVNAHYSAAVGNELLVDTTSAQIEITLPNSPMTFDEIKIVDVMGTFNTNNVVLKPNGKLIKGEATDFLIDIDGVSVSLIYYDESYGWMVKSN